MEPTISAFRIQKLFGYLQVDIPIHDNRVVLVGGNGLGKTTIVNMLYATLTKQWFRLLDQDFEALAIDIGNSTVSVTRRQLEESLISSRALANVARHFPRAIMRRIGNRPDLIQALLTRNRTSIEQVASGLDLPLGMVAELAHELAHYSPAQVQRSLFEEEDTLKGAVETLDRFMNGQVLYMPTYRRIERDLQTLFPSLEKELHQGVRRPVFDTHIEFVEFGMNDVERSFKNALDQLKESARSELNRLAATYLREVIAGEGDKFDRSKISGLTEDDIDRIIGRIEERTLLLPPSEKEGLRRVIDVIQAGNDSVLQSQQHYVAHFFMKLMEVDQQLRTQERSIAEAVTVCNNYLEGKQLVFDESKYAVHIELENSREISFASLSSGEKQIVSLFTHIYLGKAQRLFMIIDEPELSLSVDWQRRLLPDILASGRCALLVAVTHSPFIFDNQLDPYSVDLRTRVSAA